MKHDQKIPSPPEKPEAFECCGSGCVPCIFDYYDQALSEWQEKYGDPANWQANPKSINAKQAKENERNSK